MNGPIPLQKEEFFHKFWVSCVVEQINPTDVYLFQINFLMEWNLWKAPKQTNMNQAIAIGLM